VSAAVCSTCNDTHLMPYGEDRVMCTRCPLPCQKCRMGGTGAFCGKTPCECQCHDQRRVRESLDAHSAGYAEAVADIRRWLVLEVKAARGERKRARCNEYSRLIGILDIGAHVGAAKKEAT
jgi:hypothetical protein